MKINLFWRILPVYVAIGLLFAVPVLQRHIAFKHAAAIGQQAEQELKIPVAETPAVIEGTPDRIAIPRLGIDLPIVAGQYDAAHTVWTVSNGSANYAQNTALANNKHNKTVIYGHWTASIFGPTKNLIEGDTAYIFTSNNHVFQYTYRYKRTAKPSDVSFFNELSGDPGLVLMTCQGTWAQERRLMYFSLEDAR